MKKKAKFEYRFEIVTKYNNSNFKVETDDILLENLGNNGWELISTCVIGQIVYGYFKREKD